MCNSFWDDGNYANLRAALAAFSAVSAERRRSLLVLVSGAFVFLSACLDPPAGSHISQIAFRRSAFSLAMTSACRFFQAKSASCMPSSLEKVYSALLPLLKVHVIHPMQSKSSDRSPSRQWISRAALLPLLGDPYHLSIVVKYGVTGDMHWMASLKVDILRGFGVGKSGSVSQNVLMKF